MPVPVAAWGDQARDAFDAALAAGHPGAVTLAAMQRLESPPTAIIAIGKAAASMASAVRDAGCNAPGIVVTTDESYADIDGMTSFASAHPVPDERGLAASAAVSAMTTQLGENDHLLLLISGLIGIAAGDSFYLGALRRLGTRRTLTVEASGPVLASIAGVVVMGDSLGVRKGVGALLVSSAVVLIAMQANETSQRRRAAIAAELGPGLLLAFTAVICGLSGAFLARHVLINSDLTPLQTASIRLLGGWFRLLPFFSGIWRQTKLKRRERWKLVLATVVGTNGGILLQQVVLQTMPVGEGVTLMATAPVMALFVGRMEGDPIQLSGVAAAGLALAGVACTSL